ncbi:LOW QUALITY PROTEIN: calponin homology domain-containing protein DDB_G0272472-like [Apis florea]|uniref:LOW QUALITY PROTEIN: calponin homology domain-containing protein DDB_G0272472-like n=1 Tax=Apis florea TaxID=7463 RepID=UPI0012FE94BD|nr:LOW QUALITY PROTEIN: calponin homology domain-containing protein DDB_G0272472-like [Apis florea]
MEIGNGEESVEGGILKEEELDKEKESMEIGNGEESVEGGILKEEELDKKKESMEVGNGGESVEGGILKEEELDKEKESMEVGNGGESVEEEALKEKESMEVGNGGESVEEEALKEKESMEVGNGGESVEEEALKEKESMEVGNGGESVEGGTLKEKENVKICDGGETVEGGTLKEEELDKEKKSMEAVEEGTLKKEELEKEKENVEICGGGETVEGGTLKEEELDKEKKSMEAVEEGTLKKEELEKEKENVEICGEEESVEGGMLKKNIEIGGESIEGEISKKEELEGKSIEIGDGKEGVERKESKEEHEEMSDEKSEKVIEKSEILETSNENMNRSESRLIVEDEISVGKKLDETLINRRSRSEEKESSVDVSIDERSVMENVESMEEGSKLGENGKEESKTDGDREIEKCVEEGKLDLESKDAREALTVKSKLTGDDVDSENETLTKQFLKEEEEEEASRNIAAQISKIDEKLARNKRSTSESILRVSSLTALPKDLCKISHDAKSKRPPTPPKRSSSLDFQERSTRGPKGGSEESIGDNIPGRSTESLERTEDAASSSSRRDSTESWTTRENIGTLGTLLTIISKSDDGVENIRDTLSNVDMVTLPESVRNVLVDFEGVGGRGACLDDNKTNELRKYAENGARLGNGASSEIKRDCLDRETREKSRTKQSVDGPPVKIVMDRSREERSSDLPASTSKLGGGRCVERIEKIDVESRETREESAASTWKGSAPVERIVKINVESSTDESDKPNISKKCEDEERKKVSYELHEKSLESKSVKQSADRASERIVKISSEKQEERKEFVSQGKPVERIVKINVESSISGEPNEAKERTRKIRDENGGKENEVGPRREVQSRHHRVHKKIVKNETSRTVETSSSSSSKERGNKTESSKDTTRELTTSEEEFEEIYKYSTRASGDEPRSSPAFEIGEERKDSPSHVLNSILKNDETRSHRKRNVYERSETSPSAKISDSTRLHGPMEAWQVDIFSIIAEEARKSKLRRERIESSPLPPSTSEDLYYVPIESGSNYSKGKRNDFEETGPVESLKDICIKKILSMPYGLHVINEITVPSFNPFESLGAEVSKFSTTNGVRGSSNRVEDTWLGLSTATDPKLLVCLSPSQRKAGVKATADNLLDLHEKFINRRNYFDEEPPPRVPLAGYRMVEVMGPRDEKGRGVEEWRGGGERNRLLEIIKENSDRRSGGTKSVTFEESSQSRDGVPGFDRGRQRLKATRLCDWLNLARHATPLPDDLLIESSGEGGEERDNQRLDAKRLDIARNGGGASSSSTRFRKSHSAIVHSSSMENPPDPPFRKSPLSSAIIDKSVHFVHSVESPPERPDPPFKISTPFGKGPSTSNSAIIDSSSMEDPPFRCSTPFRNSPLNSAIIDDPPERPDPPLRSSTPFGRVL